MMKFCITIVGAGLAGSEAALVLSRFDNVKVKLIEMRPAVNTDVHKTDKCGELVCSNSFKSLKQNSAAGMLKYELAALASPLFKCAINSKVDAGNALAVDRIKFSNLVTEKILQAENIEFVRDEFFDIDAEIKNCDALILASGPLTSEKLCDSLKNITGSDHLSFYDAAAPIVMADSLDMSKIFVQDRYSKSEKCDYLNCPMEKDEYENFINELLNAECVIKKNFESKDLFQACQPIEEVAKSGFDAPRYGALKPTGLVDPKTDKRPYAVVQLRSENSEKNSYNLVGFQTNLTFSEQKRIFRMIPGLEKAEFARFGVMHKNTFINSPKLLNTNLSFKTCSKIFVAGQLSGTEGYMEAVRSGHHSALSLIFMLNKKDYIAPSKNTAFGALLDYATNADTINYQPMHVNFGLLPNLEKQIRNKQERYSQFAKRGKIEFDNYVKQLFENEIIGQDVLRHSEKLVNKLEEL